MGRILLVSGILFLVWMGYRFLNNTWSARVQEVERRARKKNTSQTKEVEQIRACTYCNVHIPENEGVYEQKHFFCSYQHLDQYSEHQKNTHNKQS